MIYFDNSATTKTSESVARAFYEDLVSDELFANPGSIHRLGAAVERSFREVRSRTASLLGCREQEVYFTSCGTEGSNTAITGYLSHNRRAGKTVISTHTEHKATLETLERLKKQGYSVLYVPVGRDGKPDLDALTNMIDADTAMICMTYVNNETGSVLPVKEIVKIRNQKNPKCVFFIDCVQALGKQEIVLSRLGADMATFSGHKIHGIKGVGVLYVRSQIKVDPLIIGGGQQDGMRSGTVSYALAASFANALAEISGGREEAYQNVSRINSYLREELNKRGAVINSPEDASPYIINVAFRDFQSETMLHCLESEGIFVSTVSACSSKTKKASYVLLDMGIPRDIANNSIRLSFSGGNTMEEAQEFVAALDRIYDKYLIKKM